MHSTFAGLNVTSGKLGGMMNQALATSPPLELAPTDGLDGQRALSVADLTCRPLVGPAIALGRWPLNRCLDDQ